MCADSTDETATDAMCDALVAASFFQRHTVPVENFAVAVLLSRSVEES